MTNHLVDANIILRYLLGDVQSQAAIARSHFAEAKAGSVHLFVPLLVFIEIDFALTRYYKFNKQDVIQRLEVLAKTSYVEVEKRGIILHALLLYKEHTVSFVDTIFTAEAVSSGRQLLTFDKRLRKLARRIDRK